MGSRQKWQQFRIIDELRTRHSLSILLSYSGLSRSGYYKWKKSVPKQDNNEDIVEYIKAIHSLRPFYGYRRITTTLHREGLIVNHKRVHRLMQKLGIQSVIRKKRRYVGKSGSIVFPNILGRDFKSDVPGKKLATDITYLPTSSGFIYLSAVQDLHNNEIIAYSLSARNDLELVLATQTSGHAWSRVAL